MDARRTTYFKAKGPIRVAAAIWLSASLLTASSSPAQEIESLARKLATTYEKLRGFSVTAKIQCQNPDDFMQFRKAAGTPFSVHWPSYHGYCKSFAHEGMFGCDKKLWWGDGKPMRDEMQAWDGLHWQSLNRNDPTSPTLDISRQRTQIRGGVHLASPLEYAFPFLVTATARAYDGNRVKDDYLCRVTLDTMHDKRVWQSFAQRLTKKVVLVHHNKELCWKLTVEGGFARGDRSSQIQYTVWFPVEAPVYPRRFEARMNRTNDLMAIFEVAEFHEAVDLGADLPLRFPKKFNLTNFTTDSRWLNKPVQTQEYEFTECALNPSLSEDDFKIDYSQASLVRQLDSGQRIYRKREGLRN
jgi:hypothetical protein